MTDILRIELLKEHFTLAEKVFLNDSKKHRFYCGTLKSEITLFNLLETLEKSIVLLDKVQNGYSPEKEQIFNPLPGNTYYHCHLHQNFVEISDELNEILIKERIDISIYSSLIKSLYHSLSKNRFYDNGQLIYKDSFINGIRNGTWTGWYENGEIEFTGEYCNGKCINKWEFYYSNKNKRRVENYSKDGIRHGEQLSWWENGSLMIEENYLNGLPQGETFMYFDNGQLMNSGIYKNGKILDGIYHHYHASGELDFSIEYKNGTDIRTIKGNNVS